MERIQKTVQSEMNRWFKRGNIGQVLIDREATGRTLSPGDLDRWLNETTAPFYTDQACDLVSMSQRPSLGLRIVSIEAESIVPKCALLERERERERDWQWDIFREAYETLAPTAARCGESGYPHRFGHDGYRWSLFFTPDNQLLAATSVDGAIKLWDIGIGPHLQTLDAYSGPVGDGRPEGVAATQRKGDTALNRFRCKRDTAMRGSSSERDAAINGISRKGDTAINRFTSKRDTAINGFGSKGDTAIKLLSMDLDTDGRRCYRWGTDDDDDDDHDDDDDATANQW